MERRRPVSRQTLSTTTANNPRRDGLPQVHLQKPRSTLFKASRTIGKLLQIPQVSKGSPAPQTDTVLQSGFQRRHFGR
ncbi:MAG: hypothetical protein DME19_16405, partial [Verrucomicrobia bacterium]